MDLGAEVVLREGGTERRARAAGLRAGAPDQRRAGRCGDHRGGGVPRRARSGVARVPREDGAERRDVRRARARLRVLHLRHALLREPGVPAGRRGGGGAAQGRPGDRGCGSGRGTADGARPGGGGRERHPCGGGKRHPGRGRERHPGGGRTRSRPRPRAVVPSAGHRPDAKRRRCVRFPRFAARARARGILRPACGVDQFRAARRRPARSRRGLAVLGGGRGGGVGVPAARAAPPDRKRLGPRGARWEYAAVSDIVDELAWRGLIAVSTDLDDLRRSLDAGQVTLYGGFDPTAASLHIGNLVLLLTMRRLQRAGHRPIGLVGGATGLIGDPSGKSAERALNPPDVVAGWVKHIGDQVSRFLDFEPGPASALMASNLDWTDGLSALAFLRDVGKHFPISQMLSRETVRARLEAGGISYTEFSYQILQANDFLELYRRYGCTLQVGGSDQWGNLVSGVDLIRRVTGESVHAFATPLITKPDGTKYGKTEGDAIWLSRELMSPYAFHQYWLNRADDEVIGLLKVFTFRTRAEIEGLEREIAERPAARTAQRVLADDLTTLVHGAAEAARAADAGRALFGQANLRDLDEDTLAAALGEARHTSVGRLGPSVADLMAAVGLVPSKSAARRTIEAGGAYLNNVKVTDVEAVPAASDLLFGKFLVLRRGKREVGGVELAR